MKKTYTILLMSFILSLCGQKVYAQFVLAQDTIRGSIDFCQQPDNMNGAETISNDSVFYMLPVDLSIDPWRQVFRYMPNRSMRKGYIQGTKLMRVDDYEIVEVERLSAHGSISFKNSDVRIVVSVAPIGSKNSTASRLQYKSITVSIKGRNIPVPRELYEHLPEPDIEDMVVYYNPRKETVYIQVNNGGTSAYYTALFTISIRGALTPYVFTPSSI